ncbi:MAG: prolipoprotein diacylglyceryl transferase [Dehalococcoidia bacterium]
MLTILIDIDPVAIALGPVEIRWYGLMYMVGIWLGLAVVARLAPVLRVTADEVWEFAGLGVLAGLLGGRLYYVVQNRPGYYLEHPEDILAVWQGGMAFFGAIIAVTATLVLYARWRGRSVWPFLDAGALFAAIGQPIGRIGNIVNGDVIGYPTDVPWGTAYAHEGAFAPALGVAYHPAAAYSIIAGLLLLGVLVAVMRLRRPGFVFATYLVGYSVTQFVVFFWRANSVTAFGLKQAQLTAIGVGLVGLLVLLVLSRRPRVEASRTAR